MTRIGAFVAAASLAASAMSLAVYSMKYEVERLQDRAGVLASDVVHQEETLNVLAAEWSYLNNPARLQELAARHLDLAPVAARRIGTLEEIPFRAAAQPAEGRPPLLRPILPVPSAQTAPDEKREGP